MCNACAVPSFSLEVRDVDGRYRNATQKEVLSVARRVLSHRVRRGALLDSPKVVRDFLCLLLGARDHEAFAALFVDAQNRRVRIVWKSTKTSSPR